ncbi:FAD/NAD(P)-binding domain-containing protein [Hypoxylon sp. FL1284]|nr:FAD/NAD(P)-binding domain-containing protein [Hypoxylon sp. FL1284]
MPLKILIIGAGIGGPTLAALLRRSDPTHSITVVERHPAIRRNGLQIDVRAWGIPIMRKLGLIDRVSAISVPESGMAIVNDAGGTSAFLGVNDSGAGAQSFTSEYEVMRGDLVNMLYETSMRDDADGPLPGRGDGALSPRDEDEPGVRYRFGVSVAGLAQDEKGVDVTFGDGSTRRYDLVVGADGQWSKTRRLMFGEQAGGDMFKRQHVYTAYYTIKKQPGDDDIARLYLAGKGRSVLRRTGDRPYTQVVMLARTDSEEIRNEIERQPVESQKAAFEKIFQGAGWEVESRFLKGLRESTDFYADSLGQVKGPHVVKNRVALIGDAANCASPVTGMGTTLSFVGAYMLAGELARHNGDVQLALQAYDVNVKPYVSEMQELMIGVPWVLSPDSRFAVLAIRFIVWFITAARIDKLIVKFAGSDKGGLPLPEYPELKLAPADTK